MEDTLNNQNEQILKLLKEKAVLKQDVYANTIEVFELFKQSVIDIINGLAKQIDNVDSRISVSVLENKKYSVQFKVAGDILDCFMHTNVFEFDKTHAVYKTAYIRQNINNSYCGIINVYNFLADSFKFNRFNDIGYLICRIFINREKHFFIEAPGPIGIKYSTFSSSPITREQLTEIINELVIYAITFDLFTPPLENIREVTVGEMQEKMNSINLRTAKRLGFETHTNNYEEDTNMYI